MPVKKAPLIVGGSWFLSRPAAGELPALGRPQLGIEADAWLVASAAHGAKDAGGHTNVIPTVVDGARRRVR